MILAAFLLLACGGRPPPPTRGVIERDLSQWKFRRYQQLLDVEVWVPRNKGVAYTASYAYAEALKRGHIDDKDVCNAFVTRYQRHAGIERQLIRFARRLAQESGYTVDETSIEGVHVIEVSGHGEKWALWASSGHVVKVGGRGLDKLPGTVVEAYSGPYPSVLHAGMLEGPLPPGSDEPAPGDQPADPDNPSPDWKRFGGKKPK
ncbi:MAG TPA: hypothetical protein VL172_22265 [Kofleriaceae bacterium]|nr:hypothetical protein [Kofleriaceae bacterium]